MEVGEQKSVSVVQSKQSVNGVGLRCSHVLTRTSRYVRRCREIYVRDLPCQSSHCRRCNNAGKITLPTDVTHYILPALDVVVDYSEVLQLQDLRGIIVCVTVMQRLLFEKGKRAYKQLLNICENVKKGSIVFFNEFDSKSFTPQLSNESIGDYRFRLLYEVAKMFFRHLDEVVPIVLLTNNEEHIKVYEAQTANIFVLTISKYLSYFWPNNAEAKLLCESLGSALEPGSITSTNKQGYVDHLTPAVWQKGVLLGVYSQGTLRVNRFRAQSEAYVTISASSGTMPGEVGGTISNSEQDILILGMADRNRAIHNDEVIVQIMPRSKWVSRLTKLAPSTEDSMNEVSGDNEAAVDVDCDGRAENNADRVPTGRVVAIVQHRWRDYVCTLQQQDNASLNHETRRGEKHLAVPYDSRIPRIRVSAQNLATLSNQRLIVRIDAWPASSTYPSGHFVRSLGPVGELETELSCILSEHNLAWGSFTPALLAEMPTHPETFSVDAVADTSSRKDLRTSHLIFSIDPPGCQDVDDALSVRELPSGGVELGVHIADVNQFVSADSLTDQEAARRSTTVYLADRRCDMLPEVLSTNLCSLWSGVDRFAVSVFWVMDAECNVESVWYGRTVIRNAYKLEYSVAQAIYNGTLSEHADVCDRIPELNNVDEGLEFNARFLQLRTAIDVLVKVAAKLSNRRHGVALESMEVRLQLTEQKDQLVRDILPKEPLLMHEVIAECMIWANHWVAKKIVDAFPDKALLRHHPSPLQAKFAEFLHAAKSRGFSIDVSSNETLAQSLNSSIDPADPYVNNVLRQLAVRAMQQATYFSTGKVSETDYGHYGLNLDYYTHFTSPIRRYADVMVHRMLLAAVGHGPDVSVSSQHVADLCAHMNERHRAAQNAQKASVELFQAIFFTQLTADDERLCAEAIIYNVRANGFLVYVPRYGLKGPCYLQTADATSVLWLADDGTHDWVSGGSLQREQFGIRVSCPKGQRVFRLFDHVLVRVVVETSYYRAPGFSFELLGDIFRRNAHIVHEPGTLLAEFGRVQLVKDVRKMRVKDDTSCAAQIPLESQRGLITLHDRLQHIRERVMLYK